MEGRGKNRPVAPVVSVTSSSTVRQSAMPTFPRVKRPFRQVTSENAAELAADLAGVLATAIEVLEGWSIPVRLEGRLRRAVRHLRGVAKSGVLPTAATELRRYASASDLAVRFFHIVQALGPTRADELVPELMQALGGTLDGDTHDRTAYEYAAQYSAGVLLAQSLLRPGIPVRTSTSPDFIIDLDGLPIAVEVKHPSNPKAAKGLLSDAATQLRTQREPGVILMDLSAAVGVSSLVLPRLRIKTREEIGRRHAELTDELSGIVRHYTRSDKYARVLSLLTSTHFWVWDSVTPPKSDIGLFFSAVPFEGACGGLLSQQTERLGRRIVRGVHRISDGPVQARYV